MSKQEVVFKKCFVKQGSNKSLVCQLSWPRRVYHFSNLLGRQLSHYEGKLTITSEGKRKKFIAAGNDFLEVLLNALEILRNQVPIEDQRDWVDEFGAEFWVVLPRTIPFGWGYALYRKISDLSIREEMKFVATIEKRQLASKRTKSTKRPIERLE
jgi:hypothetical protein